MFTPDIKKMLGNVSSRYSLVLGTAKRARAIRDDYNEREEFIPEETVSTAIRQIYDGKYVIDEPKEIKND